MTYIFIISGERRMPTEAEKQIMSKNLTESMREVICSNAAKAVKTVNPAVVPDARFIRDESTLTI